MGSRTALLVKLARQSAAAWHALGARAFPGEAHVTTAHRIYRFHDGLFAGRGPRPAGPLETPEAMRDVRLIGFLAEEGGLFSLSPRWALGSCAVLWKPGAFEERSFVSTSPTVAFTRTEPQPVPWADVPPPPSSSVVRKRLTRPPLISRPAPPSMTRLHAAPARTGV